MSPKSQISSHRHHKQADANEELARELVNRAPEWSVTLAFYAALHSVDELTATRSRLDSEHAGLLSESATLRARSTPPPDLPPIADAYALDDDALRALAYLLVSRVIVQRGAEPVIVWL